MPDSSRPAAKCDAPGPTSTHLDGSLRITIDQFDAQRATWSPLPAVAPQLTRYHDARRATWSFDRRQSTDNEGGEEEGSSTEELSVETSGSTDQIHATNKNEEIEDKSSPEEDLSHVLRVLGIRGEVLDELMQHEIYSVYALLNTSPTSLKELTNGSGDSNGAAHLVFTRYEIEHIDILAKWYQWWKTGTHKLRWTRDFTRASVDEFRRGYMVIEELACVFEELGITSDVQEYLKRQGVTNVARLTSKTRHEYERMVRKSRERSDITPSLRLTMPDVNMIAHFKLFCSYYFIDRSLPLDWTHSYAKFSKSPPAQSELDLRHVLQILGIQPDGVEFLVNKKQIRTIPMLMAAKDWLNDEACKDEGSWDNTYPSLPRNDAMQIVKFMSWYNFYIKGSRHSLNWTTDFTRAHFAEFDQCHLQPRQDSGFIGRLLHGKNPTTRKLLRRNKLIIAKEEKHFKDHLDGIAEKGNITPAQRYHLQQYYKKKNMIDVSRKIDA